MTSVSEKNLCKKKKFSCAIETCHNNSVNNPDIIYHPFPKERERSMLWGKIVGCNELIFKVYYSLNLSHRICEKHFERKMYNSTKKHLLKTAVPTIDVPFPQFAFEALEAAQASAGQSVKTRGRKRVNKLARTEIETVYVHGNNDSKQLLVPEETSAAGPELIKEDIKVEEEILFLNIKEDHEEANMFHDDPGTSNAFSNFEEEKKEVIMILTDSDDTEQSESVNIVKPRKQKNTKNTDRKTEAPKIYTKGEENIILQDTSNAKNTQPVAPQNRGIIMNYHDILQKVWNRGHYEPINQEAIKIIVYAKPKSKLVLSGPLTMNSKPKVQIIPTTEPGMMLNTAIQISYDEICRMCLSTCKNANSIHDFVLPTMKIMNLLELHVKPESLLEEYIPKKVCEQCVEQLISFHKFKEKSAKCELFLKSFHESGVLQNVNTPVEGNKQVNFKLLLGQSQHPLCTSQYPLLNTIVLSPAEDEIKDDTVIEPESSEENVHVDSPTIIQDCATTSNVNTVEQKVVEDKIAEAKSDQPIREKSPESDEFGTLEPKSIPRAKRNFLRFCGSCRETFATQKLLDAHIKETKHSRMRKHFSCGTCETAFSNKEDLMTHIKKEKHSRDRRIACPQCGEVFSARTLRHHINRIHLGIRNYCCEFCGKQFKNAQLFKRHEVVHTLARPYGCDICGSYFSQNESLRIHKKIHQEGEYECTKCNVIFNVEYDYYHHARSHLKTSKVAYKPSNCEVCGKLFTSRLSMGFHILMNHEKNADKSEKSHKCIECDDVFLSFLSLNVHTIYFHRKPVNNVREIQCTICDKFFENHQKLHYHKRMVHQPHIAKQCRICGQSFVSFNKLYNHKMLVHFPHRLLNCHICDRKFVTSQKLKIHIRTHTGERPYKCEYCDKSFNISINLVEHTRRHTQERPYKCELCDKAFFFPSGRKKHQEKFHNPNLETMHVDGSNIKMEYNEVANT